MYRFLIVLIGIVVAVNAHEAWHSFKRQHKKQFKNAIDEQKRMKIFIENSKKIAKHNELFRKGKVSYERGLNEYSDMHDDEFNRIMNGYVPHITSSRKLQKVHAVPHGAQIPKSIDWREKGAVTDVKNQKQCGSCWTFGSNGALEGAYFRKHHKLVSFSEQNLLDCVKKDHKQCYGGNFQMAWNYIENHGGVDTFKSYPYTAKKGNCHDKSKDSAAKIKHYVEIPRNETALTHAIATIGPITVSIDATHGLKHHKSGTYYEPDCTTKLNHCVLAVGYGTDKNGDYYIIKNSWGSTWGQRGYFKMARNRNNNCGIVSAAGYPIL